MTLILHIIIALSSIAVATYAFARPTSTGLRATYALIGATVTTGTYLIVTSPAHMLQACATGIVYLGLAGALALAARTKLVRLENTL